MAKASPTHGDYLKLGRLADVLTLIQILAYDESAKGTSGKVTAQLQRGPISADSWTLLGKEHAEFFRVFHEEDANEKNDSVTLLARFVLKPTLMPDGRRITPTLSNEVTGHLMDLAVQLHDRQLQQRDRWKTVLIPVIAAIIAAGSAISAAVISTLKKPAQCPPNQSIELPSPQKAKFQALMTHNWREQAGDSYWVLVTDASSYESSRVSITSSRFERSGSSASGLHARTGHTIGVRPDGIKQASPADSW